MHAGEGEDGLPELGSGAGVGRAELQRVLRDAEGAGGRLDARALEGLHQLLEALAFHAAEQGGSGHLEAVEADLVFPHAAIAEDVDLGAAHAGGGEGVLLRAARLLRQQHRQALVARSRRARADEQRHQVRARAMGNPGLGTVDAVGVALPHRARAEAAEVGAGIRLGEDRRRQDLAGGDEGQPARLLLLRATEADKLRRDLRARAEGADAEIGATQRLRDKAHGDLAEAEAAELLWHGQAEDAHLRELAHHGQGNERIFLMPFLRMGRDLGGGEAKELATGGFQQLVIQREFAEPALGDRGGKGEARVVEGGGVGEGMQGGAKGFQPRLRHGHVGGADDFGLAHRDAAGELRAVLGEAKAEDRGFHLAEATCRLHAAGPGKGLAQRLDIGGLPGEAVGRELRRFQAGGFGAALGRQGGPQRSARGLVQPLRRGKQGSAALDQHWRGMVQHGCLLGRPRWWGGLSCQHGGAWWRSWSRGAPRGGTTLKIAGLLTRAKKIAFISYLVDYGR